MEKLTNLEHKIITAIAEAHPYKFTVCEYVYRRCKSFDKTITILELACRGNKSISSILDIARMVI